MSGHTPTPWTLHDRWLIGPSGPLALASGYRDYVTAPGGPMYQEWLANAALIVKAVNNHEALVAELQRLFKLYGHQATADVLASVGRQLTSPEGK